MKLWKLWPVVNFIVATILFLTFLFPVFWFLRTSIMTNKDSLAIPIVVFGTPTLDNFVTVLFINPITQFLTNSAIVSILSTVITLILATPAAYSLSRIKHKHNETIFFFVLTTRMGPAVSFGFPFYLMAFRLGLLDTHLFLILVYTLMNLAFSIWILKAFFDSIPAELESQARIDGCSQLGAFFRIAFPLVVPGIAISALFSFALSWNEYFYASILTYSTAKTTPPFLPTYYIRHIPQLATLSASAFVQLIPIIIVAIIAKRYLARGLVLSRI